MAITEGAKIGHTTSKLLPSFLLFPGAKWFHAFFSLHSLKTVQANGLVRPDLTLFVYECSHCTGVSMFVCVCVCYSCLHVLSVLQHRGAVEYQWRSLGLCLCPDHCAEEWKGREGGHVNGIWGPAGWLATANCICTVSDKVPLWVMILGSSSQGPPSKSNSLIW